MIDSHNDGYAFGRSLLLAACFFAFLTCSGQSPEQRDIDSLQRLAAVSKDGQEKVTLLSRISFLYFKVNPDSGIRVGEQARMLATRIGWKEGEANAYHSIGANYYMQHNLLKAQTGYWESLRIQETLGDVRELARGFHDLAIVYEEEKDYDLTLLYYKKALGLYDSAGNRSGSMGCLANIGNVYELLHKYQEALLYFGQSLAVAREIGNHRDIAYRQGRIGLLYCLAGQGETGLRTEQEAIDSLRKYGDSADVAEAYQREGLIYRELHSYPKSIASFQRAIALSEPDTSYYSKMSLAGYLIGLGTVYLAAPPQISPNNERVSTGQSKGSAQMAAYYLERGIRLADHIGNEELMAGGYRALSSADSMAGNMAGALAQYKNYSIHQERLNGLLNRNAVDQLESQYIIATKDRDLAHEERVEGLHRIQYFLFGLIGMGILAGYFLYRYRLRKLRLESQLMQEKAENERKEQAYISRLSEISLSAIRSQMNPHFIFNALNTIQSYIYSGDKKGAGETLVKFSRLIRNILDNSSRKVLPLEEEVANLQLYIDIERERFGDSFHASIEVAEGLLDEEILIPPMLIQPYVENGIKHGLLHRQGEKILSIRIRESDEQSISVEIDDNGVGRAKSQEINSQRIGHVSFANSANEERIRLINESGAGQILLRIIDKQDKNGVAEGTTVCLRIPRVFTA